MAKNGLKSPSVKKAFEKARVILGDNIETVWNPLYDYKSFGSVATTSVVFFQDPVGALGKTLADTNMVSAGQLPKGQAFMVTGVQVECLPAAAISGTTTSKFADDVYTFYKNGVLIFTVGSKEYIRQGNLMKFAPRNYLSADFATTVATDRYVYASADGKEFQIVDLLLESSMNFNVELRSIPQLPSAADARVGVTLNGYLFRNAQ